MTLADSQEVQRPSRCSSFPRGGIVNRVYLGSTVLRARDKESIVRCYIKRINIFVVSFERRQAFALDLLRLLPILHWSARRWNASQVPHLDCPVLTPCKEEGRRICYSRAISTRKRDRPNTFRVSFAHCNTLVAPLSVIVVLDRRPYSC